jgi:hypothetical protein
MKTLNIPFALIHWLKTYLIFIFPQARTAGISREAFGKQSDATLSFTTAHISSRSYPGTRGTTALD